MISWRKPLALKSRDKEEIRGRHQGGPFYTGGDSEKSLAYLVGNIEHRLTTSYLTIISEQVQKDRQGKKI